MPKVERRRGRERERKKERREEKRGKEREREGSGPVQCVRVCSAQRAVSANGGGDEGNACAGRDEERLLGRWMDEWMGGWVVGWVDRV